MDRLLLNVDVFSKGAWRRIDGIQFESCAFITPREDCSLRKIAPLGDALIVARELEKSRQGSGKYLIFTNASGVADDGGWYGVEVEYDNDVVRWNFSADEDDFKLTFDRQSYCSEIDRVMLELASLPEEIELEPCQVVFPENW